jgi:hypothetical protein
MKPDLFPATYSSLNLDASLLCDAARFHDNIIIHGFRAARPSLNFFDRSSQRDGQFFIAALETTIAQSFEYCATFRFIRPAIIDRLVC